MNQQDTSIAALLDTDEFKEKAKKMKSVSDVTQFAKELIAPTLQRMLEAELDEHLGYKKHEALGRGSGNSRNGHSAKKLKTSFGTDELAVPRDRNSTFDPLAVKRYETVESDVEERIVSMYAKGLTTRDIADHMRDIYGIEVSGTMISTITDKVLPLVTEWQNRPLATQYALVSLDGIYFKVRDNGKIVNRSAYVVLGTDMEGKKDILGIWIGQTEGAKFWMQVLTELKNRGVEDILIASIDGLTGFSDAIHAIFPETDIQQCIVHQVRNTMKYVPHKHKKAFVSDLKTIYNAPSEEAGLAALEEVKEGWPQYELHLKSWERKWTELSALYKYPPELRRIMYTTNAIESLNRQFRKVTKTTSVFPHEEALGKLLWLAQRDITRKWSMPIRDWGTIVTQLAVLFPERVQLG
jgi:putative transposase